METAFMGHLLRDRDSPGNLPVFKGDPSSPGLIGFPGCRTFRVKIRKVTGKQGQAGHSTYITSLNPHSGPMR